MSTSLKDLCSKCPHRDTCVELCPKAERYVNQDYVSQREKTIGLTKYSKKIDNLSNVKLTRKEKEIVTLLGRGLDRQEVCQVLDITRHALREALRRIRKKCDDFDY